jgi:multiple sugar transport system permease protein
MGYLLFSLIPMVAAIGLSFSSWDIIGGSPEFVGLDNYFKIFGTEEFYRVILNTGKYIAMYIPMILISSMTLAVLFNSKVKGIGIFRVLLFIPVLTSWIAGAMIWRTALSTQYGLINNILLTVGIQGPGWLTDPKWAMFSIVLVSVWKDMGFFSLILFGGLRNIDQSLYEAARIDGANRWQMFWSVTFPLVSPTLFFVLITTLINSFQLFPQVMVMTDGGPLGSTQVMVERIYKYGFRYYEMGYASALAVVLFIIIVVVTLVQLKLQKKWVYYE